MAKDKKRFIEITEEDEYFKAFVEEGKKWISRFGLLDWRIEFHVGDSCGSYPPNRVDPEARAFVTWRIEARAAGIFLERRWAPGELTEYAVRRSAFHEVYHIVVGRLNMLATMRFLDCEQTIAEEVHTIIRRMENAVFNREYQPTIDVPKTKKGKSRK